MDEEMYQFSPTERPSASAADDSTHAHPFVPSDVSPKDLRSKDRGGSGGSSSLVQINTAAAGRTDEEELLYPQPPHAIAATTSSATTSAAGNGNGMSAFLPPRSSSRTSNNGQQLQQQQQQQQPPALGGAFDSLQQQQRRRSSLLPPRPGTGGGINSSSQRGVAPSLAAQMVRGSLIGDHRNSASGNALMAAMVPTEIVATTPSEIKDGNYTTEDRRTAAGSKMSAGAASSSITNSTPQNHQNQHLPQRQGSLQPTSLSTSRATTLMMNPNHLNAIGGSSSQFGGDDDAESASLYNNNNNNHNTEPLFMPGIKREQFIPVRVAREKVKEVLSEMAQMKNKHLAAIETMEKQHQYLKNQLEAACAAYAKKLTSDYNARVSALDAEYCRRLAKLSSSTAAAEVEERLRTAREAAAELERDVAVRLEAKDKETEVFRQQLTAQIDRERGLRDELLARLKAAEDRSRELELSNASLSKEISTLRDGLAVPQIDIAQYAEAEARLQILSDQCEHLRRAEAAAVAARQHAEAEAVKMEEEVMGLEEELELWRTGAYTTANYEELAAANGHGPHSNTGGGGGGGRRRRVSSSSAGGGGGISNNSSSKNNNNNNINANDGDTAMRSMNKLRSEQSRTLFMAEGNPNANNNNSNDKIGGEEEEALPPPTSAVMGGTNTFAPGTAAALRGGGGGTATAASDDDDESSFANMPPPPAPRRSTSYGTNNNNDKNNAAGGGGGSRSSSRNQQQRRSTAAGSANGGEDNNDAVGDEEMQQIS